MSLLEEIKKGSIKDLKKIAKENKIKLTSSMKKKDIQTKLTNELLNFDITMYCKGIQGRRNYMEDRFKMSRTSKDLTSCIFDGHGGDGCSTFFNKHFTDIFKKKKKKTSSVKKSLTDTVKKLNKVYLTKQDTSGSTLNIVYIDLNDRKIHTVNLGDSRAILGYNDKVRALTRDNKPTHKTEQKYIEKQGGMVRKGRVQGVLAMSRSVGDKDISRYINDKPAYNKTNLTNDIQFVLHATDGLFDVMSNKEIYNFVLEHKKSGPEYIVNKLIKKAYKKGSSDNISICLVLFN